MDVCLSWGVLTVVRLAARNPVPRPGNRDEMLGCLFLAGPRVCLGRGNCPDGDVGHYRASRLANGFP